jgi:hypothetical protein
MFAVIVMVSKNHLLSCCIVIHRRASWETALLLINMFLRVCESLGMHNVCCFTFVWRRMVCYGAGGDDATTKGTSGLQAKDSTWFLNFQCCVIKFFCVD